MAIRRLAYVLSALLLPAAAQAAPNLVTNGSFESISTTSPSGNFQFSGGYNGGTVTGWTSPTSTGHTNPFNLLFQSHNVAPGNAASPSQAANAATNQYNDNRNYLVSSYAGASPDGGNFVALDGDPNVNGYLMQTVNGLTIGTNYLLSFYWAATQMMSSTGPTTEQIQASFGNSTQSTNIVNTPSGGFEGWFAQSFTFTATSTSQVLSFLSVGTPAGNPPLALLDGVSLTAAPEPSTWALVAVGLGAITFLSRRRRNHAV